MKQHILFDAYAPELAPDYVAPAPSPLPSGTVGASFDGGTYVPERDARRLRRLLVRVFDLMSDGRPRTLREITMLCGGTEASVSARLRDFRKLRHGAHRVEHTCLGHGLWSYRLIPSGPLRGVQPKEVAS
jgi:hypothetical protein